jgi:phage terminase small subunit
MNALVVPNLTPLQAAFVREFVEGASPYDAAIKAGYAEGTAKYAGQIRDHPVVATAIALEVRRRFVTSAPLALRTVEWLMEHSPSHKTRLDAARTILDRAGHVPPRPIDEQKEVDRALHEYSRDELKALVIRIENEIVGRARDVTPDPTDELIG